ncbi:MAG: hypothetical protein M3Q10_04650 [Chloroflexota bacterium]|nr:hypothetical protein [Chloroflexota bacterium]
MRIKDCSIASYKSIGALAVSGFSSGFNVLVGQNNAGKTAFLEALSTRFENKPHRTLATHPGPFDSSVSESRLDLQLGLEAQEFRDLVRRLGRDFYLWAPREGPGAV